MTEKIQISVPNASPEVLFNRIWVVGNRVRVDPVEENISYIYDLDIHILFVVDHSDKVYHVASARTSERAARLGFIGLGVIQNDMLVKNTPLITRTDQTRTIAGWACQEHRLNYPAGFGVETTIWASYQPAVPRAVFKKLWTAAVGTAPPSDVRRILNEMLSELRGIPVQVIATVAVEGYEMTTVSTMIELKPLEEADEELMAVPRDYQLRR